jgi:hypothetical protein
LPGLAVCDAEAIATAAMLGAREGGCRTIAARWPSGRKLKLSWLNDDDIPWGSALTGAVVLVAVERMLDDIAARAAAIRTDAVRIN